MSFISSLSGALGGSSLGAASVSVVADLSGLKAGLAEARGAVQAETGGMVSAFKAAGPLIAAAGAASVAAFAAAAVSAASDETEALNKTNEVFKDSAGLITDFAETSAASFGISKTAALETAASYGNMLQSAGLAVDKTAEMSVALSKLAADLASFNNVDPAEALAKLQAGLAGQAKPLRAFGVLLSAGRVEQEAYRAGIAKTGAELTDAQKIQARYNIIFQDTVRAQGDFSRTSDELANSQRILRAEWEDLQAEIGQALLPLMKSLVGVLKDLIPLFGDLASHAAGFFQAIKTGLPEGAGAISDFLGALAEARAGTDGATASADAYRQGLGDIAAQIQSGALDYNASRDAISELADQYNVTGVNVDDLALKLKGATDEQLRQLVSTTELAGASGTLQDQFAAEEAAAQAAAEAEQRHTEALQAQKAATDQLVPGILAVQGALTQQAADTRTLNQLEKKGADGAKFHAAQLTVLQDQLAVNGAIHDYIGTLNDSKKSQSAAIALVEKLGHQAGLTNSDVRGLVNDALSALSAKLDDARGKANGLGDALRSLPSNTTVRVDVIERLIREGL